MKRIVKTTFIMLVILAAIYIGVVVYAQATYNDVMYAAVEYESITPPADWYEPEQLGIVRIIEREGGWLHTVVDCDKEPFPLQKENPIFLYKEEFYQISSLWFTPSLANPQWQIPIGGALAVAWILFGVLFLARPNIRNKYAKT